MKHLLLLSKAFSSLLPTEPVCPPGYFSSLFVYTDVCPSLMLVFPQMFEDPRLCAHTKCGAEERMSGWLMW